MARRPGARTGTGGVDADPRRARVPPLRHHRRLDVRRDRPRLDRLRRRGSGLGPARGRRDHLRPSAELGRGGPVTHRIETIKESAKGSPRFRTKGDANEAADPWTFTLEQPTQARVAFHVPYVGYAFAALSIRWVRILLIGLPALIIAFVLLRRMWREAGEELERRKQGGAAAMPAPAMPLSAMPAPAAHEAVASVKPGAPAAPGAPATGLPPEALAPSPSLLADLRTDVERLRESSGVMVEGLVRLRGRLEGVELA